MRRFFYDTAVFVYALGRPHPYRAPCRRILELAATGTLSGEASADIVQEILQNRFRQTRDRERAARSAARIASLCRLHEVREPDVMRAIELYEAHPRLSARDAVFAAVAMNAGVEAILTTDRGFEGMPGLERIDPADEEAVATLREGT